MHRELSGEVIPAVSADVVIIGAGIAGLWTGLKLARAGVSTLIVHYNGADRGGLSGSSTRSVGAINTSPLNRADFREFMEELSQGQSSPGIVDVLLDYLPGELDELRSLADLKDIKLGVALANENATAFLNNLMALFHSHGGRSLDAWVTRLVADRDECQGIQYQTGSKIGKVISPIVILASGGYSGLFEGSVKTNNYGTMLGRFMEAGGVAANLEFVFKHGYGKPDFGALTPTEELPGAEIYDSDMNHVVWLERELYNGKGTANHFEAFKHWRNNKDKQYFIDLKYQPLYRLLRRLEASVSGLGDAIDSIDAQINSEMANFSEPSREYVRGRLKDLSRTKSRFDFDCFVDLKPHYKPESGAEVFRVRQIAYFSMGGIAHIGCATNLPNVYVIGEAMHDFGAHRVGGLPWALYLSSARMLSDKIVESLQAKEIKAPCDFDLIHGNSDFDGGVLTAIREGLYRNQECDFNLGSAHLFIDWLKATRSELREKGRFLSDASSWLIVAEGIMKASVARTESRGCFYRSDHPISLEEFKKSFTCTTYDHESDVVETVLVQSTDLPSFMRQQQSAMHCAATIAG